MTVSKRCLDEMIEHGVVLKDGKPAAADFISKPILKVALVGDDGTGKFPEEPYELARSVLKSSRFELLKNAGNFPENIENIVIDAIGYWYEGKIEFVEPGNEADMHIFGFRADIGPRGFATLPLNDHPSYSRYGSSQQVMGLKLSAIDGGLRRKDEELLETLRHEFGHNNGVLHPETALGNDLEACAGSGAQIEYTQNHPGYMGIPSDKHDNSENSYDRAAREFIHTGKIGL